MNVRLGSAALCVVFLVGLGCESVRRRGRGKADAVATGDGAAATGGGDGVADRPNGPGEVDTAVDGTDTPQPTCQMTGIRARGLVTTSVGYLVYDGQKVGVRAGHDKAIGCVNTLGLDFAIGGGCKLTLDYTTLAGGWVLDKASLEGDIACGDFWKPEDTLVFETDSLDSDYAPTALSGVASVEAPLSAAACSPTDKITLLGQVQLKHSGSSVGEDRYMTVDLNGLTVEGAFLSRLSTLSGCPADAVTCDGVTCGPDKYGVACGGCGQDTICVGGACVDSGCNSGAPGGATLGMSAGEQVYTDENGAPFSLHSLCGDPAVWMIRTALWCPACSQLAPYFQAVYDAAAPLGVKFILLVGENNSGGAATVANAHNYKIQHGYQEGWIVLVDPHWSLTAQIIRTTSNGLPSHVILDKSLVVRQSSTNTSSIWAEENALVEILIEEGLWEP